MSTELLIHSLLGAFTLTCAVLGARRRSPALTWMAAWMLLLLGLATRWPFRPGWEQQAYASVRILQGALLLYGSLLLIITPSKGPLPLLLRRFWPLVLGVAAAQPLLIILPGGRILNLICFATIEMGAGAVLIFLEGRTPPRLVAGMALCAYATSHIGIVLGGGLFRSGLWSWAGVCTFFVALMTQIVGILASGRGDQRQLVAWNDRLRALVTGSSDWVVWCAADGTVNYVNPALAKVAGITLDPRQSRINLFSWLPDAEAQRLRGRLASPDDKIVWQGELHLDPSGKAHPRPVSSVLVSERGTGGQLTGFGLSMRDLTEQVFAQRRAQRRYELEEMIASMSSDFLECSWTELGDRVRTALEGLREWCHADTAATVMQDSEDEQNYCYIWHAKGEPISRSLSASEIRRRLPHSSEKVLAGEVAWIPDTEALEHDHPDRPYLAKSGIKSNLVLPLRRPGMIGAYVLRWRQEAASLQEDDVKILALAADVMSHALDRKRSGEALAEREEELRQAQKMEAIGQLAGGVAHDFNNLLTVISGYAESLRWDDGLTEEQRDDVVQIAEAAERASALTAQLLALGRRQRLAPCAFDLNERLRGLDQMLRRLVGERVQLVTALDPDLPSIHADPSQIAQVVLNLVVNARDAIADAGAIEISTNKISEDGADQVCLSVRDTGCGIDPRIKTRIFDPFFTTKGSGKGSGLGLSVVHGIVYQTGGSIEVETSPGNGTCFSVCLPTAAKSSIQTLAESVQPTTIRHSVGRVLLVEDEDMVRAIASRALQSAGYEVAVAANGLEGVEVARRAEEMCQPFDLIVSDMVMPKLSGPEMVARLPERYRSVPVVFISGYPSSSLSGEVPKWPMAGVDNACMLEKPFRPSVLLEIVAGLLCGSAEETQVKEPVEEADSLASEQQLFVS